MSSGRATCYAMDLGLHLYINDISLDVILDRHDNFSKIFFVILFLMLWLYVINLDKMCLSQFKKEVIVLFFKISLFNEKIYFRLICPYWLPFSNQYQP